MQIRVAAVYIIQHPLLSMGLSYAYPRAVTLLLPSVATLDNSERNYLLPVLHLSVSLNKLILIFAGTATGDFRRKPMLIYGSQSPGALKEEINELIVLSCQQ